MIQRLTHPSDGERKFVVALPGRLFARRKQPARPTARQPSLRAKAERLRKFALFSELPPRILAKLAAATRVQVYGAGDPLWHQGDANSRVLFIENGLAITSRRVREGVNRTYGLYGPGDSIGIYAIWAGMKYPTDALSLNHGLTVLALATSTLMQCIAEEPMLSAPLMAEIGRFTDALIHKIEIVSAGAVHQRVAILMSMLLERYGVETQENAARLPIKLTLEQIGAITDARIETVARALAQWKRQGWLSNDPGGFMFSDLAALAAQIRE